MRKDIEPFLHLVERPGRYTGGEEGVTYKNKDEIKCRWAFCFPDIYEIGMSNLGMRILCGALNEEKNVWAERVYAPWTDMENVMREHNIPLYTHESGDDVRSFDIVSFTLQYELCYETALNMLELSGIPLCAEGRDDSYPVIVAGGPCAYNAEPMAAFVDIFSIGEGEEALPELARLYIKLKEKGQYSKKNFLREASHLPGFYVPSLYDVKYKENGTIASIEPLFDDVPKKVTKRIIEKMDDVYYPEKLVLPYIETVHDRAVLEVFRGCTRGCRFCQAGFTNRPAREKSPEKLNEIAKKLIRSTGYDEISMCTLSISDYSHVNELTDQLLTWTDDAKINLSFPSLRADSFTKELMDKVSSVRSSTLTFAPEAGTQRLRDVINKNVTEDEIRRACHVAFAAGKTQVKLYFMDGLPFETDEDVVAEAEVAQHMIDEYYMTPERNRAKAPGVTMSVACFIPKPHTPFQWIGQNSLEELQRKQLLLLDAVRPHKKVKYNYHDADVSKIEAVFARGDRRLSKALLEAHRRGIKWDAWESEFSFSKWMSVFEDLGMDPDFYACRNIEENEILPWEIIDTGVSKTFLLGELHKAKMAATTISCEKGCAGCGANHLTAKENCRWCPGHPEHKADLAKPYEKKEIIPETREKRSVKIRFGKMDGMTYIGHLDLIRIVTRVILRSGIPVYYTEGFNPIPHIEFASPLSVGCAGERELCDVKIYGDLSDEEILNRLRDVAPVDMPIHEVFTSNSKLSKIKYATQEITLHNVQGTDELANSIEEMFTRPVILMKKTKSGEKETDITPFISSLTAEYKKDNDTIVISCVTAAESGFYLNPSYIYKAIQPKLPKEAYPTYIRKALLDETRAEFR